MKKILIFNVNWIGDVIFSEPIFRSIAEKYPDAEIVCVAVPRVGAILNMISGVDRVIIYDEQRLHRSVAGKIKMVFKLRKEKFDIVFLLHGSLTRALLVFLSGIPIRVGYPTKRRNFFLSHIVEQDQKDLHRSDHYLRIIESYGIEIKDRKYSLEVKQEDICWASQRLEQENIKKNDFFVILNPGGNWDLKRWPKQNFAKLAQQLICKLNAKIGICGSSGDVELSDYIQNFCNGQCSCFAGNTTLGQLAALFKRASVVVSADSGPMHVASGVGTKMIGLFGPTHPEITGPRGHSNNIIFRYEVGCNKKPCYHLRCQDNICMKAINVHDVFECIRKIQA